VISTHTLDGAVSQGCTEPRLTLHVKVLDAMAKLPILVMKSSRWAHRHRLVSTEYPRFVEGCLMMFPFEKSIDAGDLQLETPHALVDVGWLEIIFRLHHLERNQPLFIV
jgi:hypothetical protein